MADSERFAELSADEHASTDADQASTAETGDAAPDAEELDLAAALAQPEVDEDEPLREYQEGDLPDFSDGEADGAAAASSSAAGGGGGGAGGGAPRTLPPRPKGAPPRKRLPPAVSKMFKGKGPSSASAVNGAGAASAKPQSAAAIKKGKKAEKQKEKKGVEGMADADGEEGGASGKELNDNAINSIMQNIVGNTPGMEGVQTIDIDTFMKQMGINKQYLSGKTGLMGKGTKDMASHKFWATQPVLKLGTPAEEIKEGPIEPNKADGDISKDPVELHKDFRWDTVDTTNPEQLREVYDLLSGHYVEDPDASFRFAYEASFIEWALKPPGYVPDWHIGIRVAATGKLVAFIAGVPIDLRIRNVTKKFTEINLLCVHKKLRSKRLAPLLIREVTRRTHLKGIFQAIYTAGVFLPTPVTRCQYYHRSLNPRKLVETGFSGMPRNMTMARLLRQYSLPTETALPGLREMEKRDLKAVSRLLRAYLARMDLAPLMSNKDVEHALLDGRGKDVDGKRVGQVTWTYVVEHPETHEITDMFSFYSLPSTAVKAKTPTLINAAYLYYYATTACPSCADLGDGSVAKPTVNWRDETKEQRAELKDRLKAVVTDAMVLAHKAGFDVMNCLTLQDNALFVEDLKFGKGDGFLHYYLYNYMTKPILGGIDTADGGSGVGVVML